jgi:LysR family glycine cleavage system transcriptional activator
MRSTRQKLPLNALRAFEAVGRHLHMRRAAEELCVTQSAVSQQVRNLESLLDIALLERRNTGLVLTPAGGRLLQEITAAFDDLVRATDRVNIDSEVIELRIACSTGLASNWLVPHLDDFLRHSKGYAFQLVPLAIYPQAIPSDVDLAISYGKPPVSEKRVTRLEKSPLVPVGSAKLFGSSAQMNMQAQDLTRHTLIHADDGSEWREWFRLAGLERINIDRNLYLGAGYHLVLDCVERGMGIGLLAERFLEKGLASGRLTILNTGATFQPEHYYVIRPEDEYRSAAGRDFESWFYGMWGH